MLIILQIWCFVVSEVMETSVVDFVLEVVGVLSVKYIVRGRGLPEGMLWALRLRGKQLRLLIQFAIICVNSGRMLLKRRRIK